MSRLHKLLCHSILIVASFSSALLFAQPVAEVRTYGGPFFDEGRQVIEAEDGYLIVGTTASADQGNSDIYVLKIAEDLTVEWSRMLGGAPSEQGRSACVTSNGEYLVLGQTSAGPLGGYDLVLYRLSADGQTLWERHYGTDDWDLATRIVRGDDDLYYIASTTFGFSPGDSRQWMFRIDENGEVINGNTYDFWPRAEANDLVWYNDHLYMIGTRTFPGGEPQGVIRKLTPSGATVWEHVQDSTDFAGMAVHAGPLGVAAAFSKRNNQQGGTRDIFVAYLNEETGVSYTHNWLFSSTVGNQVPRSITWANSVTIHAGITDVFGDGGNGCYIGRINMGGFWLSATVFGGEQDEEPFSILFDSQGRIVFTGSTTSYGNDFPDVYLVRLPDEVIVTNYELDIVTDVSQDPFTWVDQVSRDELQRPWPNPAGRQLNLPPGSTNWQLRDLSGRLIGSGTGDQVNVAHYPRGFYLIEGRCNGVNFVDRIVLE